MAGNRKGKGKAHAGGSSERIGPKERRTYADDSTVDSDGVLNSVAAPQMDDKFYADVDKFLAQPPPALPGQRQSSGLASGKVVGNAHRKASCGDHYPSRSKAGLQKPASIKTAKKPVLRRREKNKKELDTQLLQQAFAYVDSLAAENIVSSLQGATADDPREKPAAHVQSDPTTSSSRTQKASSALAVSYFTEMNATEPSRKQYTKPQRYAAGGNRIAVARELKLATRIRGKAASTRKPIGPTGRMEFDNELCSESQEPGKATDIDALVANFRDGVTLRHLREELEQSKASYAHALQALNSAAANWNANKEPKM